MGILVNENEESLVHCFACEFGGTIQTLVETMHEYGDKDYTKLIAKIVDMETADPEWLADTLGDWEAPREGYTAKVIDEKEIAHMLGKSHPYIIRDRGLEIATLKAWGAGYDEEQRRAVFPVRRANGDLVGMVGRAISKRTRPKYLNYFDFDKGRYLYGENMVKMGTSIVVCEGLLDALAAWQSLAHAGRLDDYSVTSFLGSIATRHQLRKLVKLTDEVILFLDNDPAGWSGQMGAARYLGNKVRTKAVNYPAHVGGDPASLVEEGVDLAPIVEGADLMVV